MRIVLDEARDTATFYFSNARQSSERGGTYLVLANDEDKPRPVSIEVQLGFEADEHLLWMTVRPASVALPAELFESAERV